jgi:hypothetical protein
VIGRQDDTHAALGWEGHDVLNIPDWTRAKNDAWVKAGIDAKQSFYMASPEAGNRIQTTGRYAGQPTIYARELDQLRAAGYQQRGDYLVHPDDL